VISLIIKQFTSLLKTEMYAVYVE